MVKFFKDFKYRNFTTQTIDPPSSPFTIAPFIFVHMENLSFLKKSNFQGHLIQFAIS